MGCCKKILLILTFVLFCFCSCSFAATPVDPTEVTDTAKFPITQHDNIYDTLTNLQLNLQSSFVSHLRILNSYNPADAKIIAKDIYDYLSYKSNRSIMIEYINNGYRLYFYEYSSITNNNTTATYHFNWKTGNNGVISFSNTPMASIYVTFKDLSGNNTWSGPTNATADFPLAFCYVLNDEFIELFKETGLISHDSTLSDVVGSVNNVNNSVNNLNNGVNNLNNNITDDNVNVDPSTLPSDNTQDITDSGFNNIFQMIYNTFTSGTAKDLVINIPFTNKSFTINTSNVYGGANLGLVKTLINAFWYFIISYFIVKDIGKKINKIKSGDIEHVQEDNIKEDLL